MKELAKALIKLAIATGGKEPDEQVIAVYLELLSRYDQTQVIAACGRLSLKATFFPSVGEIVGAMGETDKLRAAEAWARLRMDDPATAETVRLIGGLRKIQLEPLDKLVFLERRFLELLPSVEAKIAAFGCPAPRLAPADESHRIWSHTEADLKRLEQR